MLRPPVLPTIYLVFFFNDTAPTEIYTLSLHDALPISWAQRPLDAELPFASSRVAPDERTIENTPATASASDRKSTRLNSSHVEISYAVFCLKKKKNIRRKDPAYRISKDECMARYSRRK